MGISTVSKPSQSKNLRDNMPNDLAVEFSLGENALEAFTLTGDKRFLYKSIGHLIKVCNELD